MKFILQMEYKSIEVYFSHFMTDNNDNKMPLFTKRKEDAHRYSDSAEAAEALNKMLNSGTHKIANQINIVPVDDTISNPVL
jgi:ribosomal protein L32